MKSVKNRLPICTFRLFICAFLMLSFSSINNINAAKTQLTTNLKTLKISLTALKTKLSTLPEKLSGLEIALLPKLQESDVTKIFEKLKSKLDTSGSFDYPDSKLDEVLTFPINKDTKTQSLSHIRIYQSIPNQAITQKILDAIIQNVEEKYKVFDTEVATNWNIGYIKTNNADLKTKMDYLSKKVVPNILANEIKYKDNYYVFYHAHIPQYRIFFDTCQQIYRWGRLNNNQPLVLRIIKPNDAANSQNNLITFLGAAANLKPSAAGWYTFDGETGQSFDGMSKVALRILSLNLSFFGNINSSLADSSIMLGLTGIPLGDIKDRTPILIKILTDCHIDKKYATELATLGDNFFKNRRSGFLLQFFVKKDVVDHVAYLSNDGGRPFDSWWLSGIIDSIWSYTNNSVEKISPFLDRFINDSNSLDAELLKLQDNDQTSMYHGEPLWTCSCQFAGQLVGRRSLDQTQARLWLSAKELYDPNFVIVKRYDFEEFPEASTKKYYTELNGIFEKIIKDIIHDQKNYGIFTPTPLKTLVSEIIKLRKNPTK